MTVVFYLLVTDHLNMQVHLFNFRRRQSLVVVVYATGYGIIIKILIME